MELFGNNTKRPVLLRGWVKQINCVFANCQIWQIKSTKYGQYSRAGCDCQIRVGVSENGMERKDPGLATALQEFSVRLLGDRLTDSNLVVEALFE